jgi:hypothetical protein
MGKGCAEPPMAWSSLSSSSRLLPAVSQGMSTLPPCLSAPRQAWVSSIRYPDLSTDLPFSLDLDLDGLPSLFTPAPGEEAGRAAEPSTITAVGLLKIASKAHLPRASSLRWLKAGA